MALCELTINACKIPMMGFKPWQFLWGVLICFLLAMNACNTTTPTLSPTVRVIATRYTAQLTGKLALVDNCLRLQSADSEEKYLLVWPPDFTVRIENDTVYVSDSLTKQQSALRLGDLVEFGGGETRSINDGERVLFSPNCTGPLWIVGSAGALARSTPTAIPQPFATPAVTVQIIEQPSHPEPTPVICTALPPDMSLTVTPLARYGVQIEMSGLQPGEQVLFIAHAESSGYSSRIEAGPVQVSSADRRRVQQIYGLGPLPGSTQNRWEIQVVHSRGVACTEVTLP